MGKIYGRNRDQEGEHRGVGLLPAAVKLKGTVGARSAQDEPGPQIVAHIGEGRSGRGTEPDEQGQGDRRETEQNADDQCDQRHGEGREPPGMHRRDADDQFMHKGGKGGVDDKGDQHARRQFADEATEQGDQDRDRNKARASGP